MSNSVNSVNLDEQLWLEFEDTQDASNEEEQKQQQQIAHILSQTNTILQTIAGGTTPSSTGNTTTDTPPKGHPFEVTVAAFDLMYALINFSGAANEAQADEANNVSENASLENTIALQGSQNVDTYFDANIQPILNAGSGMSEQQQAELQGYNTEVGLMQSENEQATKSIDPIVSRGQDMISQDVQNLNTVIDEAKTVSTGFSATIQAVQALR